MRPPRPGDSDLDARRVLEVLSRHDVRVVVVGSFGAIAQGAVDDTVAMTDIDLTPDRDPANLARLVAALDELGARYPDDPDVLEELRADPVQLLATKFWTFATDAGGVDVVLAPAGFERGFADLAPNALVVTVGDVDDPAGAVEVLVARAADIYESKRRAGRPKDQAALAHFVAIHGDVREVLRQRYRIERERR